MESPDQERLAHHEAGHAVAARNLNLDVVLTRIDGPPEQPGWTELGSADRTVNTRRELEWFFGIHVMAWLAGRESVSFFFGSEYELEDTNGDEAKALNKALEYTQGDETAAKVFVEDFRGQLRGFIRDLEIWQAEIKAVAAALIAKGLLNSAQIDAAREAGREGRGGKLT